MKETKNYNYLDAMLSIVEYNIANKQKQDEITEKRLKHLLIYAKENKEYFKELYKNLDIENIKLEDIPPTNKFELMENFENWTSIPELNLKGIDEFLSNSENFLKKYLNEYSLYQTSGTTGNPITVINNQGELNITMAIGLLRSWFSYGDLFKMVTHGITSACILPTNTPCISTYLAHTAGEITFNKGKINVIGFENNLEEIVEALNKMQPVTIGGYVTFIEMLVDEAKKGNLNIKPLYITTVGEKLTKETQDLISSTFNCTTLTNYACTECGEIAHMCKNGHFHINTDWTIVEPVDLNNKPISDGEISDKILVTNLWNYTQPFIRYEINDRCIMHHEQCSCGIKTPWLEVEGRAFKALEFIKNDNSIIKISPISIELIIHKNDKNIKQVQFVLLNDEIELRLLMNESFDKKETFEKIKKDIEKFLFDNNIKSLNITLSKEVPKIDAHGKFKKVYQE